MDNVGKMYAQVANAAGVSEQNATIACYLLNLSRDGRSLDDAAGLLRVSRAEARDHARSWGIPFADYDAAAIPSVRLEWTKERRGRWVLKAAEIVVAIAESDGQGAYRAKREGAGGWVWSGSSAAVAMKRASRELERDSVPLFGSDDVEIYGPDADGAIARLAPVDIGPRDRLTRALHH